MEVALLHVWNSGHTVSDAVFRSWCRIWPEAEQHTASLAGPGMATPDEDWNFHRAGLVDEAILLSIDRNYDLILSTSPQATAHFPQCRGQYHFCYLPHASQQATPQARFDLFQPRFQFPRRLPVARHAYLAPWNFRQCDLPEQVTHWVSASRSVRELNGLPSSMHSLVLYPPLDTQHFRPDGRHREGFYLAVCRDRIPEGLDLADEACRKIGRRLVIAAPPEMEDEIPEELQGQVEVFHKETALASWYNRCAGVIFPGVVDFDPAMLEAQACGAPVVAFSEGSALELVIDAEESEQGTGIFFDSLEVGSLVSALEELERRPHRCSATLSWSSAAAYSAHHFERRTMRLLREVLHAEGIRTLDRELRASGRDAA